MRRYKIFNRSNHLGRKALRFSDTEDATRFLQHATLDHDILNDLRRWAVENDCSRRQDAELVRYAASHLVYGDLRVAWFQERLDFQATQSSSAETAPNDRTSKPRTSSGERVTPSSLRASKSEASPKSTLSSAPVDIAKQIATLLAAAKSGAPFCEQCQNSKSGSPT